MQFFVTGTGTDIGKTYFLEKIARQQQNIKIIKPVISGFNEDDANSDLHRLLKALGQEPSAKNFDEICLYKFTPPLAPNIAAKISGEEINFDKIVNFCQDKIITAKNTDQKIYIEGAGGIMTPITDDKTYLDLVLALKIPVILVSKNYLGTISHSLSAIKVLEDSGVKINHIAFNHMRGDEIDPRQNLEILQNFTKVKIKPINAF